MSAALILSGSAADFLRVNRPLLFTLGNEIQDGLKMEKAGAFNLTGSADADRAEMPFARALIKFGTRKATVKFHPLFWCPYPDGQAVGLILK